MKIISKHKDFYDGAGYSTSAQMGVYQRAEKELEVEWMTRNSGVLGHDYQFKFQTQLIGFCGKLYPFIEYVWKDIRKETSGTEVFYNFEEFAEKRESVKDIKDQRWSWNPTTLFLSDNKDLAKMWFDCDFEEFRKRGRWDYGNNRTVYVKPEKLFLEHKVPYFFLGTREVRIEWRLKDVTNLVLNPILGDYKFGKIKDAWTCYQDIEMFLNNEIVRPDDPYIAPVDDKTKAESHGFDKYSFRADKGKKKRKKKS